MPKKPKKLGIKTSNTTVSEDDCEASEQNITNNIHPTHIDTDEEVDKICCTLDKLTLDALILMQQQIHQKLNIERAMTDGELHLSKSRYIMGQTNVSKLQLPITTSADTEPCVVVDESTGNPVIGTRHFSLKPIEYQAGADDANNVQDPLKWFGLLVPRDLRAAQKKFRDALDWIVDCANTQIRLHETCIQIKKLMNYKSELKQSQERSLLNLT